jgi:hypothetical protein
MKFIRKFGVIYKPLMYLLKKNNFGWNEKVHEVFMHFKKALCEALVFALSDFNKSFVLDINTCDYKLVRK